MHGGSVHLHDLTMGPSIGDLLLLGLAPAVPEDRQGRGLPLRGDPLTATPAKTLETLSERRTSVLLQLDRTQQKTLGAQRQTKPWRA